MIFDTSKTCGICAIRDVCSVAQKLKKAEELIKKAEVRYPYYSYIPLITYFNNELKDIFPLTPTCEYFRQN